jgi:hypothetical protein
LTPEGGKPNVLHKDVVGNGSYRSWRIGMKYSVVVALLVSCAITLALGVHAQEMAPKPHSMTGCLEKGTAPGSYMLTHVTVPAKGPKTVGIVSSTVNLAPHIGHKVEITGTAVPPKDAEMDKNVPKAPHYMKITALKHLSTTCP